jgi:DNA-binding transcriptional ArsR family regulator
VADISLRDRGFSGARKRAVSRVTPRRPLWTIRESIGPACGYPSAPAVDDTQETVRPLVCYVHHMVNDPFRALSHPIRRGIVERLAAGPATVGDATGGFGVSKPAITKHLKVLEKTGVVRREVVGRTHRLSLEPDVLSEAADWMDRQRALWGRLFDVVDDYLKEDR